MSDRSIDQRKPISNDGDAWLALRRFTAARIALGRSGASLPTHALLAFGVAHAQARDAVRAPLDVAALAAELTAQGHVALTVTSRATDRAAYLARPDWGRRLSVESRIAIEAARGGAAPDVVIVIADGLSATGVQRHAADFLAALLPLLDDLAIAPLVIATQARVALADEVGEVLGAGIAISLIGERPGLSSADSLGAYLTCGPKIGRVDAERNCISNIRPDGLPLSEAAGQTEALIRAVRHAGQSGVALRFDGASLLPSGRDES
jgi:ethanolamine ammonia-lyase small subunit